MSSCEAWCGVGPWADAWVSGRRLPRLPPPAGRRARRNKLHAPESHCLLLQAASLARAGSGGHHCCAMCDGVVGSDTLTLRRPLPCHTTWRPLRLPCGSSTPQASMQRCMRHQSCKQSKQPCAHSFQCRQHRCVCRLQHWCSSMMHRFQRRPSGGCSPLQHWCSSMTHRF
jgi:hypothetical protein